MNFYNNILEEFITKDIVSLGLDSKDDIIQKNSIIMTTVNVVMTANITANIIILAETGIVNNSYA